MSLTPREVTKMKVSLARRERVSGHRILHAKIFPSCGCCIRSPGLEESLVLGLLACSVVSMLDAHPVQT